MPDRDAEHVYVDPEWIVERAADTADSEWSAGFATMLAAAAEFHWVYHAGRIRAHVVHE
jgi:hypothetical protein